MDKKKLGIALLAEDVDITSTYLSGIEKGNKIASLKKMIAIANRLDMSLDFIFLDDMKNIDNDSNIDVNMNEFKMMLKELDDKELVNDFVCYCRVLSKEIANRKGKKIS